MLTKTVGQLTALSSINTTDKLLVEQGGVSGYGTPSQLIAGVETVLLEQLIPEIPTVKDISASNQTTDLTVYETGGASAKTTGYTIHVTWSGGDATYYHKFTSGGDFYNQFFPTGQTPGDGSATFSWCGYGTGGLKLRLRANLVDWDVLTDGGFDKGSNSNGRWNQFIDKQLTTRIIGHPVGPNNNIITTFPIPYADTNYVINTLLASSGVSSSFYIGLSSKTTTTFTIYRSDSTARTHDSLCIGEWRD